MQLYTAWKAENSNHHANPQKHKLNDDNTPQMCPHTSNNDPPQKNKSPTHTQTHTHITWQPDWKCWVILRVNFSQSNVKLCHSLLLFLPYIYIWLHSFFFSFVCCCSSDIIWQLSNIWFVQLVKKIKRKEKPCGINCYSRNHFSQFPFSTQYNIKYLLNLNNNSQLCWPFRCGVLPPRPALALVMLLIVSTTLRDYRKGHQHKELVLDMQLQFAAPWLHAWVHEHPTRNLLLQAVVGLKKTKQKHTHLPKHTTHLCPIQHHKQPFKPCIVVH